MSMEENIIVEIISSVLQTEVNVKTSQENESRWDSLKHIQLIMELEERLGIEIPIEIVPDLTSIRSIVEYIDKNENDS